MLTNADYCACCLRPMEVVKEQLNFGDIMFDENTNMIDRNGERVRLTGGEAEIFSSMIRNTHISYEYFALSNPRLDDPNRNLKVYLHEIKYKLLKIGSNVIAVNIFGKGYRLEYRGKSFKKSNRL